MPRTVGVLPLWWRLVTWSLIVVTAKAEWQYPRFDFAAFIDSCGGASADYLTSSGQPNFPNVEVCPEANTPDTYRVLCEDATLEACYCVPPEIFESDSSCIVPDPETAAPCTDCDICGEDDTCFVVLPDNGRLNISCDEEFVPSYDLSILNITSEPTMSPTMHPTPSGLVGACIYPDPESSNLETTCEVLSEADCGNVFNGKLSKWYEGASCPEPRMMHCPPKGFRQIVKALYCWKKALQVPCRCK